MKKWLTIGGLLMFAAWTPFLWKELTSSPAAKKARDLPTEDGTPEPVVAAAGAPAPEPAEPEPAAAEPEAPAPEKPGAKPAAAAELARAGKAEAEPEPTDPPDEVEDEPPPAPTASGPTSVLKAAFETQPRDALWAKDTERYIGGLFGGADVPAELLQNATCRKAVCRLQLRWTRERAPAYVGVYQSLHQEFGPEVGVEPIGELDADGRQQVDVYVARKGYTVADLAK